MRLTNAELTQAHGALSRLMDMDLPIMVSLDIALVSNLVEQRVKAFGMVRDQLLKTHHIQVKPGEQPNITILTCTLNGETEEATEKIRAEAMQVFSEKFTALLEARTEDLLFKKIQLPKDITIKPGILKALTDFVEVV